MLQTPNKPSQPTLNLQSKRLRSGLYICLYTALRIARHTTPAIVSRRPMHTELLKHPLSETSPQ